MKMKKWLIKEFDRFIDEVNSILSKIISPSKYQCPICGKTSSDASEINADLYDHIYIKDNK
jgi:hypothetical protein